MGKLYSNDVVGVYSVSSLFCMKTRNQILLSSFESVATDTDGFTVDFHVKTKCSNLKQNGLEFILRATPVLRFPYSVSVDIFGSNMVSMNLLTRNQHPNLYSKP